MLRKYLFKEEDSAGIFATVLSYIETEGKQNMNNQKSTYEELWQQYSQDSQIVATSLLPHSKSCAAAMRAILNGESQETILQMLEFDPQFQRIKEKQGYGCAKRYVEIVFEHTCSQDVIEHPPLPTSKVKIVDMGMLDTEYAQQVAEDDQDEQIAPSRSLWNFDSNNSKWNVVTVGFTKICLLFAWMLLFSVCLSCWISFTRRTPLCNKPIRLFWVSNENCIMEYL